MNLPEPTNSEYLSALSFWNGLSDSELQFFYQKAVAASFSFAYPVGVIPSFRRWVVDSAAQSSMERNLNC